eukprot:1147969-Pelagomonas_calceolata.AAC.1
MRGEFMWIRWVSGSTLLQVACKCQLKLQNPNKDTLLKGAPPRPIHMNGGWLWSSSGGSMKEEEKSIMM